MSNKHIIASIGLLSDTHFEDRLFGLPEKLASLWAGVGLILHAGDVGELGVLDLLSHIAPVVAVHGNDEPEHVKQELPYQQLISIHGSRVLLWHSHYPDPKEEMANRSGTWGPKMERIATTGRQMKANLIVYGHTHIPIVHRYGDILLVNPGALAAGSYFTRQAIASVGRVQFLADGSVDVAHFDVSTGQEMQLVTADPEEDFSLLAERYQTWMVEPGLVGDVAAIRKIEFEDIRGVIRAIVPLYKRCMADGPIMRRDFIEIFRSSDWITANDRRRVLAILDR